MSELFWRVQARRVNDSIRGGYGALPVMWVRATTPEAAAEAAHLHVGAGVTNLTRTVVEISSPTGSVWQESVRWWHGGEMVEPVRVRRAHSRDGLDISTSPTAERDADQVVWWTHDAEVWLHLARTSRGLWRIIGSDHLRVLASYEKARFQSVDQAFGFMQGRAHRAGLRVQEVTDFVDG